MMGSSEGDGPSGIEGYARTLVGIRTAFEGDAESVGAGARAIVARSDGVDGLIAELWEAECAADVRLRGQAAVVALGGYGRRELFPGSDVDVMFLLDGKLPERAAKEAIRRVSQEVWDAGGRAAPVTRGLGECERFDPENVEATLAMLDARLICGDRALFARLEAAIAKTVAKEGRAILGRLGELVRARHAKYGGTLFHLEPNVKDCPGGLRDVHVCAWMERLAPGARKGGKALKKREGDEEFAEAFRFLATVRCFLHYRRGRDDNTLDWQAQDEAARVGLGLRAERAAGGWERAELGGDASYWMRGYFRHARVVNRRAMQALAAVPLPRGFRFPRLGRGAAKAGVGFRLEHGAAELDVPGGEHGDPAQEPHVVLGLFVAMAEAGFGLARETEDRLTQALPALSEHMEEGPALWHMLRAILTGANAGTALRAMHALGLLELLIPEFHGIDALVIRDAYHRYTVDEHTFVLIDTLHGLERPREGAAGVWAGHFYRLLKELAHPELLFLVALLHDTGKGRSQGMHAVESERMTRSVLGRLELDAYQTEMVCGLVRHHLEMSAALRRDIFDAETVRSFAGKVMTTEALRMLALFTYADINAVHPDALTPWKAENLWRLYIATSNVLDRNVDEDRVRAAAGGELVQRVLANEPKRKAELQRYLEGLPERYLRTRTPEQIGRHFEMATRIAEDAAQLDFRWAQAVSEITLVTRDREMLFATMAGVLAAWGMNIVTADAFSNGAGVVVDSFRFTDGFRTLEMNESERTAFVASVHAVLTGEQTVEKMLQRRKRGRRRAPKVVVTTKVDFDMEASTQSTLVQVVAQDTPGLLRALSLTFASQGCNVEVALVDTEGEMAIDVFYLTEAGRKLGGARCEELRLALLGAIEENAR